MKKFLCSFTLLLCGCVTSENDYPFDYQATGYSVNQGYHYKGYAFRSEVYSDDEFYSDCVEYQMEFCYD